MSPRDRNTAVRTRVAEAVREKSHARARRSDAAVSESHVREVLLFLGFEEIAPGYFVRLDGTDGRTRRADDARFYSTVRLGDVVGNAAALRRIAERFRNVHGRVAR